MYTDDFERPAETIVRENLLTIVAALFPERWLSHSSAATRGALGDEIFTSGPGRPGRHLQLPGVRVIRLPALAAPECDAAWTPTEVVLGVDRPPEFLSLKVSTPLQTVFECLTTARAYPAKTLPEPVLSGMIAMLPASDRERAERFAVRNALRREYLRYRALSFGATAADRIQIVEPDAADVHFYGWRIGRLTYLGGGEYRFEYDAEWPLALSSELPLRRGEISYEGRRMPAFFENCLPEGWTESVVLASNKLSRDDLFGLFSTTRKYLSNITLRPLGMSESTLAYDAHTLRLHRLGRPSGNVLRLREEIGEDPGDPILWRRTRTAGPLRLSGVQPKLPVSLLRDRSGVAVRIGDLRHACTHILKIPTAEHPELIRNEWATMELARRIDLPVAAVAMVQFQPESRYSGPSLLVERYDIPDREALDAGAHDARLMLQEDACSLLHLRREDKYRPSLERVAAALLTAGLDPESPAGMRSFLDLALFSWIIGNGDLHAKNISIVRNLRIGRPGEAPVFEGVEHAPFYDLVNTRIHLPNDDFALPIGGRRNGLRLRSFVGLAKRWGMSESAVRSQAERITAGVGLHLNDTLAGSGLTEAMADRYRRVVRANSEALAGR